MLNDLQKRVVCTNFDINVFITPEGYRFMEILQNEIRRNVYHLSNTEEWNEHIFIKSIPVIDGMSDLTFY
jgi:hypothetical protein